MRVAATFSEAEVSAALKRAGLKVLQIQLWSDLEDGEVTLEREVFVQCGEGYLIVNRWTGRETIKYWPERCGVGALRDIVRDAREALAEAGR